MSSQVCNTFFAVLADTIPITPYTTGMTLNHNFKSLVRFYLFICEPMSCSFSSFFYLYSVSNGNIYIRKIFAWISWIAKSTFFLLSVTVCSACLLLTSLCFIYLSLKSSCSNEVSSNLWYLTPYPRSPKLYYS